MTILKKAIPSILACIAIFYLLSLLGGFLLKITPMPEKLETIYIIAVLAAVCLICGIFSGLAIGKAGLITGLSESIIIVFSVFIINSIVFGSTIDIDKLLHVVYIIPLGIGTLGGIIGANLKK